MKKTNKGDFPTISEGVCLLFSKWFFFFPFKFRLCFILGFSSSASFEKLVAVVSISQSLFFLISFAFPCCFCFSLSKRGLKHLFLKHTLLHILLCCSSFVLIASYFCCFENTLFWSKLRIETNKFLEPRGLKCRKCFFF